MTFLLHFPAWKCWLSFRPSKTFRVSAVLGKETSKITTFLLHEIIGGLKHFGPGRCRMPTAVLAHPRQTRGDYLVWARSVAVADMLGDCNGRYPCWLAWFPCSLSPISFALASPRGFTPFQIRGDVRHDNTLKLGQGAMSRVGEGVAWLWLWLWLSFVPQ